MRSSRDAILDEMLRTLVGLWGYSTVAQHVEKLRHEISLRPDLRNSFDARKDTDEDRKRSRRPSAFEHLNKVEVPPEKREPVRELALRFDTKHFLPSIGDARNFLQWKGIYRESIRTREELIPLVIQQLIDLPKEDLEKIVRGNYHFGPSRLGPLSDAISTTSAIIRGRDRAE